MGFLKEKITCHKEQIPLQSQVEFEDIILTNKEEKPDQP